MSKKDWPTEYMRLKSIADLCEHEWDYKISSCTELNTDGYPSIEHPHGITRFCNLCGYKETISFWQTRPYLERIWNLIPFGEIKPDAFYGLVKEKDKDPGE